jgi:hypothetical protein
VRFPPTLRFIFTVMVLKNCYSPYQPIEFNINNLFSYCNLYRSTAWRAFKQRGISQNLSENIYRAVCSRLVAGADRSWAKKNTLSGGNYRMGRAGDFSIS